MHGDVTTNTMDPKPRRQWRHSFATTVSVALALVGCGGPPGPQLDENAISELTRETVPLSGESAISILRSQQTNESARPAIYIHGTPGEATGWADYVAEPVPGTSSIAIDRPGFGASVPEREETSLAAQAAAIAPLFDRSEEKPILIGHSLGGPIVAQAAVDFPGKIAALVIVAGSLDPDLEDVHWVQPIADWAVFSWMLPRQIRNANRELIDLEVELRLLAPRLSEIDIPVVIVHGTEDDLVPYANVDFMVETLTGAPAVEVMKLEGVNHFLPWNSIATVRKSVETALSLINKAE